MEIIKGTHIKSISISEILVDQLEVRVRNSQIKARTRWGKSRKTTLSNNYSWKISLDG